MDPFSISIGILTIVDACLKSGKVLIKLYDDHHSADIEVSATLLKLKTIWHKTEKQMAFLQTIWDSLEPIFQTNQILLLSSLQSKLQEMIDLLNSVISASSEPESLLGLLKKKGSLRKTKYAFGVKDSLDKTFSELLQWSDLFDPSWYLLSRVAGESVDRGLGSNPKEEPLRLLKGLRKSVQDLNHDTANLPLRPISSRDFLGTRTPIASSSIAVAPLEGRIQHAVVDTMQVDPTMDVAGTTRSVMALTKALSRMNPFTFGILRCCGVINKTDRYELVFEVPQGIQSPRSLRNLLNDAEPSLNVKVNLSKQLAKSIFYVHAAGFVHKNIRPESILVFDHHGGGESLFLCGFENFRAARDDTFKTGDALPERDLYRHPLRQGRNPERRYVMQHDIYSLGICLLEIGLWDSFVRSKGNEVVVNFNPHDGIRDPRERAFNTKTQILITTNEQLAQRAGDRFKEIVQDCLTCLDDDTTWHQIDDNSAPAIGVGIDYIENVISRLHEIVV